MYLQLKGVALGPNSSQQVKIFSVSTYLLRISKYNLPIYSSVCRLIAKCWKTPQTLTISQSKHCSDSVSLKAETKKINRIFSLTMQFHQDTMLSAVKCQVRTYQQSISDCGAHARGSVGRFASSSPRRYD